MKNDASSVGGRVQAAAAPGTATTMMATSAIVPLDANDFVTLRVGQTGAGGNLALSQGAFTIHWLGPKP